MPAANSILSVIKSRVLQVDPEAKVLLFGSRARGTATEESDWDVLILTPQPVHTSLKKSIYASLFPLSVEIGAFINALVVQQEEWLNNAAWYSLRQAVKEELMAA